MPGKEIIMSKEIEDFWDLYKDAQKLYPQMRRSVKLTHEINEMVITLDKKIIIKVDDEDVDRLYRVARHRLMEWLERN